MRVAFVNKGEVASAWVTAWLDPETRLSNPCRGDDRTILLRSEVTDCPTAARTADTSRQCDVPAETELFKRPTRNHAKAGFPEAAVVRAEHCVS
jgi:hypothetical protein